MGLGVYSLGQRLHLLDTRVRAGLFFSIVPVAGCRACLAPDGAQKHSLKHTTWTATSEPKIRQLFGTSCCDGEGSSVDCHLRLILVSICHFL